MGPKVRPGEEAAESAGCCAAAVLEAPRFEAASGAPHLAGEAGSRTTVLAIGDPPARADARKIEDDGNAAQAIVDFLAEKRLV